MTRKTVWSWENGKANLDLPTLSALAKVIEVEERAFFSDLSSDVSLPEAWELFSRVMADHLEENEASNKNTPARPPKK